MKTTTMTVGFLPSLLLLVVSTSRMVLPTAATSDSTILSVHGSGATSPSKCYRSIFDQIESRAKLPVRFTYRGTGSTVALAEIINDFNVTRGALDFNIIEIPLPSEDWQKLQEANVTVLHLPTLFYGVSFFHSVPNTPQLNLTSCLLSRIFLRDLTDWAHPDIRELNPGLDALFEGANSGDSLGASLRIRVAVRELGSSNAKSISSVRACKCFLNGNRIGFFQAPQPVLCHLKFANLPAVP